MSIDSQADASNLKSGTHQRMLAWHTKRFLIVFYGITASLGMLNPRENSDLEFLLAIALSFSMAWWAITDASDRGGPIRPVLRFLVIISGWLAAPIYLLWTRGLRGLGWLLLNAVAFVIVLLTTLLIGQTL